MSALEDIFRRTLDQNWREGTRGGVRYRFTVPSASSYPWQWYWDSCFHALARCRWDSSRAQAELETLLAASADGFIGHTIFWTEPLSGVRRLFYNVERKDSFTTSTIQPPLLAWTWSRVVGDARAEERVVRHNDWLRAHRVLDSSGLLWIVQPDESGMDALPKFDHVWGREAQGTPLFPLLVRRNRRLGWDARRITPRVCEVLTNVCWCLAESALGLPSLTPALVERLWDERAARFVDTAVGARHDLAPERRPLTWDTLAPLVLPDLPDPIAERLVDLYQKRFARWRPLPAVAPDEPAHDRRQRFLGLRRHWRGPSWINSAWLVALGLRRLGLADDADRIAIQAREAVSAAGLREYYDSFTGRGLGARDFSWSALALDI